MSRGQEAPAPARGQEASVQSRGQEAPAHNASRGPETSRPRYDAAARWREAEVALLIAKREQRRADADQGSGEPKPRGWPEE